MSSRPNGWLPPPGELEPGGKSIFQRRGLILGCLLAAVGSLLLLGFLGVVLLVTQGDQLLPKMSRWFSTQFMLMVEGPYDQAGKSDLRDELTEYLNQAFQGGMSQEEIRPVLEEIREAMLDGKVSQEELEPILQRIRAGPAPAESQGSP